MTQDEIDGILRQARRRNAETGVTGLLLYLEGNFLQLLEGEDPALNDTYERIKADVRHRNLIKMVDGVISERSFGAQPMAFRAITLAELDENPDLFVYKDGRWTLRGEAGVEVPIKVLIETFLRVNASRGI